MIKDVIIRDFQSHRATEMEFHPGVNVICGRSDSGKSSVLRALEWVRKNRPLGDSVHRRGGPEYADPMITHVAIGTGQHSVNKHRTAGATEYFVDDKRYAAVGTDVPDAVKAALWEDINFQSQLDLHYMIMDPASQIAAHLNEVTGMAEMSEILSRLATSSREVAAESKVLTKAILGIEAQLGDPKFEKADRLDEIATEMVAVSSDMIEKQTYRGRLSSTVVSVEETKVLLLGIPEGPSIETVDALVEKMGSLFSTIRNKQIDCNKLTLLNDEVTGLESSLEEMHEDAALLEVVNDQIRNIETVACVRLDVQDRIDRLGVATQAVVNGKASLIVAVDALDEATVVYNAEVASCIGDSGKCPVCDQDITEDCVKTIVENLEGI